MYNMNTKGLVSIIIPSRNEKYLYQTTRDLLNKAKGEIEIFIVLDGYWPPASEIIDDPRVNYIHYTEPKGMRNAINKGVALANGEYILKTDAHCMFAEGFDKSLKGMYESNEIIVPRRYRLDPEKWEVIEDGRPPVDYEYLDSKDLHGVKWEQRAEERKGIEYDAIISAQGSCYFMEKEYFEKLGGLDSDTYGSFYLEFQELSFKAWTSGGMVVVNKNTWYAHFHKTKGRGYNLNDDRQKAVEAMSKWREKPEFKALIEKFMPMPTW